MTPAERDAAILAILAAVPMSASQLAVATGFSLSCCWNALQSLLFSGKIVLVGYGSAPGPKGGGPMKLYAPASHGPHGRPLIPLVHRARRWQSARRVEWKPVKPRRFAGSGVIAGRITIGRGSKWGAGRV